jgi:hypothetical protein
MIQGSAIAKPSILFLLALGLLLSGCSKGPSLPPAGSPQQPAVATESPGVPVSGDKQWIAGWKQTSGLSGARAGAAAVVVNGYIYLIGGVDGVNFLPTTEYSKINDDGSLSPWSNGPRLNEERGFIDAIARNGFIYVVGGGNGPNGKHLLQTVERARVNDDGSLSAWVTLNNAMIIPRRCSKVVLKDNYIYSFGGFGGALLDSVERAEILADGDIGPWSVEPETLTIPRYVNTVKNSHGNTYVIGGHDQMKGVGITDVEWTTPNDNDGAKAWKKTSPMQVGRYGLSSASHADFVYAIGGLTGLEYLSSIEVSAIGQNGELGPWRYTTALFEPRATFNALVYRDWIYIIGGTNQDRYLNTVEYAAINEVGDPGFWGSAKEAANYQAKLEQLKNTHIELPNYGQVKEVLQASMYTYLQVVNDSGAIWLAGPKLDAAVNDKVRFSKGVSMPGFYSKELQRTFPTILFVSKIEKE